PDGVGASDARHGLHLRTNAPVLHCAKIDKALRVVGEAFSLGGEIGAVALPAWVSVAGRPSFAWRSIFYGPPIDLAEPRRNRSHDHVDVWRQAGLRGGQALGDLLARKVNVGPVAEDRSDLGKAVAREGRAALAARDAGEGNLDRKSNLLFDLKWRQGGRKRIDLDLHAGDIRHRIDRQPGQRPPTQGNGGEGEQQDKPVMSDRKS